MNDKGKDETLVEMALLVTHHANYPQGNPQPVVVTLSDEQWNSVVAALSVVVAINQSENAAILPPWMHNQIIDALVGIKDAAMKVIEPMADQEVISDMERQLIEERRKKDEETL